MPSILDYLNTISDARYGRDVRQAIVDAISACYQDGRAGVSDLEARRLIESAIGVNESQQADIDTLYAQIADIQGGGGESSQESTTITLDTVIYDGGFVDSVTVNNNATKTYDVTFTQTFTEVPEVFACVAVQNSAAASYSKVTVGIVKAQTTTTGFRFFIANTSGATRSTTVVWAAFQPTTKEIDLDITIPSGEGMSEADVLAITNPIQTALDGVKTGYDGTVYSTPGEAVRTQINDLHVLIGDEPGTAISGSSIGYDGTDSGLSATDMQSAVDEVADALSNTNERLHKLDNTLDYSERTIRMDNPTMWRNGWVRPDGTYGSATQNLVNRTMYAGNGESCTITMAEGWVIQKISEYGTADDTTSYVQNIFADASGVTSITATLEAGKFYVFQISKEPIADVDLHEVTDNTFVITYIKGSSEVIDTLTANVGTLSGDVEDIKTALDEVVEPKFVPTVTFTDGKGINQSTGAVVNDTNFSYSDYVETQGLSRVLLTMPVITTSLSRGIAFYDESKTYISGKRCIINSEGGVIERNLPIPENAAYFRTTWFASTSDQYPLYEFKCVLNEGQLEGDELTAASANALDVSAISYGYLIDESNSQSFNDQFCVTDYIPVKQGEILVLSYAPYNVAQEMLRVTVFNKYRENVSSLGTRNVNSYTVPEGVGYVRVSTRAVNIKNTSYIHKDGTTGKFQPYARESVSEMAGGNYDNVSNLLRYPLSTLPSYIIKNLAYKPLGQLTKGYVCFVSDDGAADLTTYTIPMFISKGVPGTWAVMSDSQCFLTEGSTAVVVDSVQNHGCEIAQHASSEWTGYDEFTLNRFFDAQETFFSNLGLTAYGAVCPAHQINDMVRCVAGGRFGCLRTGFGHGAPYYGYYMNGARSNLYGLSCFSLFDKTAAEISAIIDTAVSEHLLCIIFWHDQSLTVESKTKFEAVVDYAKTSGAELITMKDIPTII